MVGRDRRIILGYEKGQDMSLTTAMCIADVLGLTLDELVGKKEPYTRRAVVYCPNCGTIMKQTGGRDAKT